MANSWDRPAGAALCTPPRYKKEDLSPTMDAENLSAELKRIHDIMPDLVVKNVAVNDEGLANRVLLVNHELIFRFARGEHDVQTLAAETLILDLVRPRLPVAVPRPIYAARDLIAYRFLPGESLHRQTVQALDEAGQQAMADQLAAFLRALHLTPVDGRVPPSPAPVRYDDWVRIRQRVEERVYPLLMAHQRTWAQDLFDSLLRDPANMAYTPRLIHGDLGPYHILFDRRQMRISAVIDFGVAGRGDPANDLAVLLYNYGEQFMRRLRRGYPEMEQAMARARFYAQAIELQWVLAGIESGDTFWFLTHLGGARDVRIGEQP